MVVEIRFVPRASDYWKAGMTAIICRRWLLYLFVGFFVILPWLAAGAILWNSLNREAPLDVWNFRLMLLMPFAASGLFSLIPIITAGRAQRGAPALRGEHTYRFCETGVRLTGSKFESQLEWSAMTHFLESPFGTIFFSGHLPLIFVPRRAFVSERERQTLESLANAHVGKAA